MNRFEQVSVFLWQLQQQLLERFAAFKPLLEQSGQRPNGYGRSYILEQGATLERLALHFTQMHSLDLPSSAAVRHPEAVGLPWRVCGLSLIVHPTNPFAPTVHLNYRYFEVNDQLWWFGGGSDLTPHYPFSEDAIHFHQTLKAACDTHHPDYYPRFKTQCDQYFINHHRQEARGIGGIFFDDFTADHFETAFGLVKSAANAFIPAYFPILDARHKTPFTKAQRDWQLYRRGRYVEFNLVHDRGTLFGLQSGGRIENILSSLPPLVAWGFDYQPEVGTLEAGLTEFLKPKDWATQE